MKKSLIALLTISSLASATVPTVGNGDELQFSTSSESSFNCVDAGGLVFNLNTTSVLYTAQDITSSSSLSSADVLWENITLTSITYAARSDSSYYVYFVDMSDKTVVGMHSTQETQTGTTTGSKGTSYTIDFTNDSITLETGKQYAMVFASSLDGVVIGQTAISGTSFINQSDAWITRTEKKDPTNCNEWGFVLKDSYSVNDTGSVPVMTIKGVNTPEPATATLSLLALAGLCARRRRK